MTRRKIASFIAVALVILGTAGCRPDNPLGRKPISGKVTLDGAPIESGSIDFQPLQAGGTSSGGMITNGSYSIVEEQGLPVGKYRVTIVASAPSQPLPAGAMPGDDLPPPPPAKQKVPPEWNEKGETIEVKPEGPFEFSFTIETKKK